MTKVAIELQTVLDDQSQWDYHTTRATGNIYHKAAMDVLMFSEETEVGPVKNMLTIQSDKVSIKRSGALTMHQQFKLQQPTENRLQHPYVTIYMETHTDSIFYDAEGGYLRVAYRVKLNGEEPRQQLLELSFVNAA